MSELSLSNVITVSVSGASRALGQRNMNTIALLTVDQPATAFEGGFKTYKSVSEVAKDFGTNSSTYEIALAAFMQPQNMVTAGGSFIIVPLQVTTDGTDEIVEDLSDAILRLDSLIYSAGVITNKEIDEDELLNASDTIQALKRILVYVSSSINTLSGTGVAKKIYDKGNFKTKMLLYTQATDKFKMLGAYVGRAFSTQFAGNNTTQTMNLKDLIGILPDLGIEQTIYDQATAVGVDLYVSYEGVPKVVSNSNVLFFDSVYNRLWLENSLEVAGFNTLATTRTKIPQTEQGMDLLKNAVREILKQGVRNAFLAAGTWNSPDFFGDADDLRRNVSEFGFYIWSLPITEQLQIDREERKAPLIQVACKEAGAIHSASLIINIEA